MGGWIFLEESACALPEKTDSQAERATPFRERPPRRDPRPIMGALIEAGAVY